MFIGSTQKKSVLNYAIIINCLVFLLLFLTPVFVTEATATTQFNQSAGTPPEGDKGAEFFYTIITVVFGWLAGLAGDLLNYVSKAYVLEFGKTYTSSFGVAIEEMWLVIRDLVNILFIFGLVYIGFRMIFDSESSEARKNLALLIIAALFINFSLYITKFIIDFSNVAAFQFASQAFISGDEFMISTMFADKIGASSIFDLKPPDNQNFNYGQVFGILILYLSMFFAFVSGAFILLIRFVMLCIYMVFSPFLFAGMIFPGLKDTAKKHWNEFLKKAFVAPIYFLFLLLSYQMLSVLITDSKTQDLFLASGTEETRIGVLIKFLLVSVFMIASVVAAQKLGAEGADKAVSLGKSAANKARSYTQRKTGDLTAGGAAKFGRYAIGGAADRLSQNQKFNAWAAKSSTGRKLLNTTNKMADASFDVRNVGGLGKELGIGEGKKGGYRERVKERVKRDEEFAKSLVKTKVKDKDGNYVSEEMKDRVNEQIAEAEKDVSTDLGKAAMGLEAAIKNASPEYRQLLTDEKELREGLAKEISTGNPDPNIIEQIKVSLEKINDRKQEVRKTTGGEEVEKAQKKYEEARGAEEKSVVNKITYQNQISFMNTVRAKADRVNNYTETLTGIPVKIAGGTVGGVGTATAIGGVVGVGTGVVTGAGAIAGMSAGEGAAAYGRAISASADKLEERYGRDGSRGADSDRKDKENDLYKEIKKLLEENAKKKDD